MRPFFLFPIVCIFWSGLPGPVSAQLAFRRAEEAMGLTHAFRGEGEMGSGVAVFDYDGDHDEDVLFTGGYAPNRLFENDGRGNFTDVTDRAGLRVLAGELTNGAVTGDLDNDGDQDILLTTRSATPNQLWRNNGDGTFTNVSVTSGIQRVADGRFEDQQSYSATLGDYNLDGLLDIYVVNWIAEAGYLYDDDGLLSGFAHRGGANRLYLNQGNLTFTDVAPRLGLADTGCGLATTFSDYDQDDDVDVLIANDFGAWTSPDALYRNDFPQDTFADRSAAAGFDQRIYGMGLGVGDYDRDGDLDYYKTNIGANVLLQNAGDGTFTEVARPAGVVDEWVGPTGPDLAVGWGAGFTDLDNDGWPDLVVANGRVGSTTLFPSRDSTPDRVFLNRGDGTFTDVAAPAGVLNYGLSRGLAYGDLNGDGRQDLLFSCVPHRNLGLPGTPAVFLNESAEAGNWLRVRLVGTSNNRDALGSRMRVFVGNRSWVHEISGGGQGHNSRHSTVAHFGLGAAARVDSLRVEWLGDFGPDQTVYDVAGGQTIMITEGEAGYRTVEPMVSTVSRTEASFPLSIFPNPTVGGSWLLLDLPEVSVINVEVMDLAGRVVWARREVWGAGQFGLDLPAGLGAGVYVVRVRAGGRVRAVRWVVW